MPIRIYAYSPLHVKRERSNNLSFYKPICLFVSLFAYSPISPSAYQHNKAYLPIRIYAYSPLHEKRERSNNLSFYKPICLYAHTRIRPSAHQRISVSAYQRKKAYLHIRIYAYSPLHEKRDRSNNLSFYKPICLYAHTRIRPSAHQPISPSAHQPISPSAHQHISVSASPQSVCPQLMISSLIIFSPLLAFSGIILRCW